MKKIGILTYHKSINYGAFMQCYALSHKLSHDFPEAKVEVINYATDSVFRNYSTSYIDLIFGTKDRNFNKSTLQVFKLSVAGILKLIIDPKHIVKLTKRKENFEQAWRLLPLSEYSIITDDFNKFF